MIRALVCWLCLLSFSTTAQNAFETVVPGRDLAFPGAHNLQQKFQSQWWYVTANLKDNDGKSYGAQFTLFSNALIVGNEPRRIHFAHAALSTPKASIMRKDTPEPI